MRSTTALARALDTLARHGRLPASAVSRTTEAALGRLLASGVLRRERAGGGSRLVVADAAALRRTIAALFPAGLEGALAASADLASRHQAVLHRGDAKAAARGAVAPVLLRGFGGVVLRRGEQELDLGAWTAAAGLAAIDLDPARPWQLAGTVAVVENLEPFRHAERLVPGLDAAVYAGGRLADRVSTWLAGPALAGCRFIHCGDYDPVGLDEYLRLRRLCPGRVTLHVPADLDARVARHGNRELLARSAAVLRRLRTCDDPAVLGVIAILDRHGRGLEQEALLGDPEDPQDAQDPQDPRDPQDPHAPGHNPETTAAEDPDHR